MRQKEPISDNKFWELVEQFNKNELTPKTLCDIIILYYLKSDCYDYQKAIYDYECVCMQYATQKVKEYLIGGLRNE